MASLAEKIEADANAKLTEKRQPGDDLTRYKGFLKLENSRLQMLHRAGGSGREVCHGRATMLDVLLRHILEPAKEKVLAEFGKVPRFSLVAIGGYGRAELNPFSDIDFMFLHETDMVGCRQSEARISAR